MSRSMLLVWSWLVLSPVLAAEPVIPHAQEKPPNDPRDAETAAKLMTVPEGFVVEVVAAEPMIVNPVAMAIDEKGRFWITESLEYPRRSAGPGKDRVKVLEDTDGDGRADKETVFLDGLNIPSGVQVGHGGVWIANAPEILFVPDANRDGVPDGPAKVVVTGFGRTDTHELPNSLTWGPDGWLYGLNGVFNHSHVKYAETSPHFAKAGGAEQKGWPITCAMFRIHPRTLEFQVFCEGTSNPWGIAFNDEGDAFVSACVIDHLWHLVETGYYHRQGGPYPPHTWKIDSIVKHKHQKAAYCGITWFDSDAYPEKFRNKLYMGNIHGGCINVDRIERNGSTYAGFGEPDFLTANDAWFMPVVQKTGPDGCLYVLDWYDRYHCYQDANRDPAGIDRLKGRLYRVRYTGTDPVAKRSTSPQDLGAESDAQLIDLLGHPNVWTRETAQRLLQERSHADAWIGLQKVVMSKTTSLQHKRHALFAMIGQPRPEGLPAPLAPKDDPVLAAWNQRAQFDDLERRQRASQEITAVPWREILKSPIKEPATVKLQFVIGLSKLPFSPSQLEAMLVVLAQSEGDLLIPHIVWQNLHPLLEDHTREFVEVLKGGDYLASAPVSGLLPRIVDRILSRQQFEAQPIADLLALVRDQHPDVARALLAGLAAKVQTGELSGDKLAQLKAVVTPLLEPILARNSQHPLRLEASLLSISWGEPAGFEVARSVVESSEFPEEQRLAAVNALVAARNNDVRQSVVRVFEQRPPAPLEFRGKLLASLARLDDPAVASFVLQFYPHMEPDLQPRAVELLTQRPSWSKALLTAIGDKQLPASVINVNQARRLAESKDDSVRDLLAKHWGVLREGRSGDRDRIIADMRTLIRKTPGDAMAGEAAFKKVCAQCHKIYGEGAEVGPDITLNGRNDFTQLLSNVFDPSLVIGSGYRSFTVATEDGRVLNGLLVEDSPQRVVLKVQGGKQEIIARDNIDVFKVSEISLMPEQLERQLSPQEIADLFAFLTLDKHPRDPQARRLPGVYEVIPRESTNPADFASIVQEVAPGFTEVRSGLGGVALLAEQMGRKGVVRTHPVNRDQPGVLAREITLPNDKKAELVVELSHDPRGDWRFVAYVEGRLIDEIVGKESCGEDGWVTYRASLEKFAGKTVKIQLLNQANDWAYEFGYWGSVRIEMAP